MARNALLEVPASVATSWIAWGVGGHYVSAAALDDPPLAPSNRLFFPKAIALVGAARDPDWSERERTVLHFPTPIPPLGQTDELFDRLEALLEPKVPAKAPPSLAGGGHFQGRQATVQAGYDAKLKAHRDGAPQRRAAHDARKADEEAKLRQWITGAEIHAEGVASLHRAFKALTRAIVDLDVTAYFRPVEGGKLSEVDPDIFTRPGIATELIRAGVYVGIDNKRHYLFVDGEAAERKFPSGNATASYSELSALHLSPEMQLAVDVIKEWGITPTDRPSVDSIATQIAAMAVERGIELSERRATEIARIVRGK